MIMAGGRATRFRHPEEKGVLEIEGRTLLERSVAALKAGGVDDISVAVTHRNPRTRELAKRLGIAAIETRGEEYHQDILELLAEQGNFISLNVDVPFVRGSHVKKLTDAIEEHSIACVVPACVSAIKPEQDSIMIDAEGTRMLWVGLNFVTTSPETSLLVYDDPLLAINVNTEEDLLTARKLAKDPRL